MSITYKVASTYKPGEGTSGEKIWFPKLTGSTQVDLPEVARILAERSTASEAVLKNNLDLGQFGKNSDLRKRIWELFGVIRIIVNVPQLQ